LVDSGMIHALPGANLILDATADVASLTAGNAATNYAHLSTSLKSMADLDVDEVVAGTARKVYIDLGLPVKDPDAMKDISALLASLDSGVKALAFDASGKALDVSMVMSKQMMQDITSQGGFSANDLMHLRHLGVTEFAVLDYTRGSTSQALGSAYDAGLTPSVNYTDFSNSASGSPAQSPLTVAPIMPDVKVIGLTDPLHSILDPTHIKNT